MSYRDSIIEMHKGKLVSKDYKNVSRHKVPNHQG